MSNIRVAAIVVGSVALASVLGLGVGTAVAGVSPLRSPAGLSSDHQIVTQPMSAPTYPKNASGETYGSAAISDSPAHEPDLIQAASSDGQTGYVKKVDLDQADGTTAAQSFKTPEDALKWQEGEGSLDHVVPVYLSDGKTQIGTFTVVGGNTQRQMEATAPKG